MAQISFTVTAKLISAFVFTTRIVQFLYFLNPKFPASSHLLCLHSPVSVRPDRNPNCWFSHTQAHFFVVALSSIIMRKTETENFQCCISLIIKVLSLVSCLPITTLTLWSCFLAITFCKPCPPTLGNSG